MLPTRGDEGDVRRERQRALNLSPRLVRLVRRREAGADEALECDAPGAPPEPALPLSTTVIVSSSPRLDRVALSAALDGGWPMMAGRVTKRTLCWRSPSREPNDDSENVTIALPHCRHAPAE